MTWVFPKEDWVSESIPEVCCISRREQIIESGLVFALLQVDFLMSAGGKHVGWHHINQASQRLGVTLEGLAAAPLGLAWHYPEAQLHEDIYLATIGWRQECGTTAGVWPLYPTKLTPEALQLKHQSLRSLPNHVVGGHSCKPQLHLLCICHSLLLFLCYQVT